MSKIPFELINHDRATVAQRRSDHKNTHKFKKIYKESRSQKREENQHEVNERLPVHMLFSSQTALEKKESLKKAEAVSNSFEENEKSRHVLNNEIKSSMITQSLVANEVEGVSSIQLDPQVLDLFEKMAGVMTVMTSSGISETTITLNSPSYASSLFYGAQIIISEYSTAPKAFNIQFRASSEAVALFHRNAKDLMAVFDGGNYNFKVNRLETDFLDPQTELFTRKENVSSDEEEKYE
jgi:hypothetical protein